MCSSGWPRRSSHSPQSSVHTPGVQCQPFLSLQALSKPALAIMAMVIEKRLFISSCRAANCLPITIIIGGDRRYYAPCWCPWATVLLTYLIRLLDEQHKQKKARGSPRTFSLSIG